MSNSYPVSFANYPKSFKGCVVSPTKICLQFNDPEIKLRIHDTDRADYTKFGPNNDIMIPVGTLGTTIKCTAIGCQMPVVEDYQLQLIDAYVEYSRFHSKIYEETYSKSFKDFLLKLQEKINWAVRETKWI